MPDPRAGRAPTRSVPSARSEGRGLRDHPLLRSCARPDDGTKLGVVSSRRPSRFPRRVLERGEEPQPLRSLPRLARIAVPANARSRDVRDALSCISPLIPAQAGIRAARTELLLRPRLRGDERESPSVCSLVRGRDAVQRAQIIFVRPACR